MNSSALDISRLGLNSYKDKIPAEIYSPMQAFTQSDVFLVPIHKAGKSVTNNRNHSHKNVEDWIESLGGYRIGGWTLDRNNKQLNEGIYVWRFHSDWLTNDNKLVNVTIDNRHLNLDKHTFWHDTTRHADLNEGYTYNDLFITPSKTAAAKFNVDVGRLYWFAGGFFKPVEEFDGRCYWLQEDYPKNFERLETEWGIRLMKTDKGFMPSHNKMPANLNKDSQALEVLFRFSMKKTPNSTD